MMLAYSRVSTLEQAAEDRVSISEQLRRCKAVADLRGQIGKYQFCTYEDRGVSGSVPLYRRPGGRAMLEHANQGDCLIASKLDRIFRSASDALNTVERLKRKGVDLIICDIGIEPINSSPSAKMFFGMMSLVAQFERERIHERITEGKAAKRARGGATGGITPFGFRKIGTGRTAMLEPCPREREHIRYARDLYDEAPTTWGEISDRLALRGMLGRNGEPYGPMAISRMITASSKLGRPPAAAVTQAVLTDIQVARG